MKNSVFVAISLAALTLAACKKDEAAAPAGDAAASTAASEDVAMATASPTSPGQAFANAAAASDSFEIETSKLAAARAASTKVKRFAETMIKAHTESTAKLQTAAAAASPAIMPAAQLSPTQQQTLDTLSAKSGADFDSAYAKAQVDAHQATLAALKSYSATGDVASLKTFATQIIPIVTAHLNMAKALS